MKDYQVLVKAEIYADLRIEAENEETAKLIAKEWEPELFGYTTVREIFIKETDDYIPHVSEVHYVIDSCYTTVDEVNELEYEENSESDS